MAFGPLSGLENRQHGAMEHPTSNSSGNRVKQAAAVAGEGEAAQQQQQQQQQQKQQKQQQQPQLIECRKKNSKGESVVTHRYHKGRLLGKGGFAHCYKVICADTKRAYAMKIVPKSTLTKSRARQKLQTEIKIHRTLDHPRIVHFEKFFEDRENVYILLELCSNHSLSELIRKTKRFTEDEARRYMLQILEATSYLHRHQIIHRDLKLGNVFLDGDWNIKMGDFGLATKLVQDSERKRTICGTPNYIAPEILAGTAGHSYQVDLWSAGVILYTMLVGRPPYESTDVKATYRRILANVYAFPENVPVSDSAKNLVGRLLQVKPELRPSLDEILNHPFLLNGGPPQRFSTAYGLRGSSSSSSSTAAVTAAASGRAASQKLTPERCTGGGGGGGGLGGRPPLKTRSANVDSEGDGQIDGAGKGRSGSGALAQALADGGRETHGRHGSTSSGLSAGTNWQSMSSRTGATATVSASSRSSTTSKGEFNVYCDVKEGPGGAGLSGSRTSPSSSARTAAGRRTSPALTRRGRREAAATSTAAPEMIMDNKENDPRLAALVGPGEAVVDDKENDPRLVARFVPGDRVPVKGPVLRRPLVRAASAVGATEVRGGRSAAARGGGDGGGAGASRVTRGSSGTRRPLLRSASTVAAATHADGRAAMAAVRGSGAITTRTSAAAPGGGDVSAGGRTKNTASPRLRAATRGSKSPAASRTTAAAATTAAVAAASYSPYRSPAGLGSGTNRGAAPGPSFRGKRGDGKTPPQPARRLTRSSTQQRLEFASTPGSATRNKQQHPAGAAGPGRVAGRIVRRTASSGGSRSPLPAARLKSGVQVAATSTNTRAAASSTTGAACSTPPASQRRPAEGGRDTLETMHDFLSTSFAMGDREGAALGAPAGAGTGRASRSSASAAAARVESETRPPAVWVTRYVDYSSKYGLGFLLSDGSAGVYFNDATKIVLEPAGVKFDYIERARRVSQVARSGESVASGSSGGEGGGSDCGSGGAEQPPRVTHTLDDFPPELQKKVTLLNHFRGYLHELVRKEDGGLAGGGMSAGIAGKGGTWDGKSPGRQARTAGSGAPLVFLKKWLRTRNAILFRLSNRTVQVVFSDHTEILLSEEARIVTFVDKEGSRQTQSLQRVLLEQRYDVTKRVRYSKELIAQLLRRS